MIPVPKAYSKIIMNGKESVMMTSYGMRIRFNYGHYEVYGEDGEFLESCDTYEEAQRVIDCGIID